MDDTSLTWLFGSLAFLIVLSGFFSSSETGMLSLNKYRLKHLRKQGHQGARKASELLARTDQLISVILIGNNFVNILASSIATVIAIRLWGDAGIAIATALLTLVILIFAEITPKTYAAYHPERIAFAASHVLTPLLKLLYPAVWSMNLITSRLLKALGIDTSKQSESHISREELKTLVHEAKGMIPRTHQDMLISILDLEKVTVNDIMVPKSEIIGLNIDDSMDDLIDQVKDSQHTRVPVYKGNINNIIGVLHLRNMTRVISAQEANKALLLQVCREPYFIPESTPLNQQLLQFQKEKRRIGIVVDEYGDVLGLATMEDILEEIVGEFTTDYSTSSGSDITKQEDGSYLIDGSTTIRSINKTLNWSLPTDGPKTLNGLIIEELEFIPELPLSLSINGYHLEVRQVKESLIKTVRANKG
ncbi:magnesium/cobalt efflux protein [Oleiphilus sp. HI0071]|uniref:HlyC/CorC family transporter n=3 Tax=Oleiphilus TaxID=141450 RepID=UPI0007C3E914|nr:MULTISPECIES: HlyC/CorC family transporter [unclassified Oleiphilus]KZY70155.1 magnesium/cobalt efflux protein [Oleiphilus sp. HI0065]KZY83377.1 magnesium/cobalt efflux protein [Oleiphilus sp. HI0071]KZY91048.1 magnesium/cobalt efflux protein [Oleiphilus sp. HI0073]KZZ40385.1 magnesium/cobalt efflux protein [Oleiphilus sp. HI0118]KZZ60482.1 magnesium/cobalt efflux protein [Oleiphilus sp. HI0122]KZZ71307.1 magnesium/cobalt efflux protein [Oleiphilus sp. HI0130]KZZ81873.1 magnesium/cobalt e